MTADTAATHPAGDCEKYIPSIGEGGEAVCENCQGRAPSIAENEGGDMQTVGQNTPVRPKATRVNIGEPERELKMAERSALLLQVAAIEKYLGIKRRCKKCGTDL